MTTITPLIISLTSVFIQHIFLIVLVGIAFSEYVTATLALRRVPPAEFVRAAHYAKATRTILLIVGMAALWFIGEYFFDTYSLTYRLAARWPLVTVILGAFIVFGRTIGARGLPLFRAFVILLALFIALDVADYVFRAPWTIVTLAFERIIAMLALFFFSLGYFMRNKP